MIFMICSQLSPPFYPHTARRNPCVILFLPDHVSCHRETGEQHHSFGLYPVTGGFSFPASSASYKPCGSKPFTLCEHFHIRRTGLRVSAADRWFSLIFHKTCHLAFPHMTCRMFSCHYWHPFGVHVTPAVSGHVVAMRHYLFTIKKLPSTGERQSPITVWFMEHCGLTGPAHPCPWELYGADVRNGH